MRIALKGAQFCTVDWRAWRQRDNEARKITVIHVDTTCALIEIMTYHLLGWTSPVMSGSRIEQHRTDDVTT